MIPNEHTIHTLWDTYTLSDIKRNHSRIVAAVACDLAKRLKKVSDVSINMPLLYAGAMLHDLDKNTQQVPSEHHPDTGVRILREQGFDEVADLIKTHSLVSILDQTIAPKTWEEKLLFLADKMVKHDVIGVDERFSLWRKEDLPVEATRELDQTYPLVKALEKEVFGMVGITPNDGLTLLKSSIHRA